MTMPAGAAPDEAEAVLAAALALLEPGDPCPMAAVFASAGETAAMARQAPPPHGSVLYAPGDGRAFVCLPGGLAAAGDEDLDPDGRYQGAFLAARYLDGLGPLTGPGTASGQPPARPGDPAAGADGVPGRADPQGPRLPHRLPGPPRHRRRQPARDREEREP